MILLPVCWKYMFDAWEKPGILSQNPSHWLSGFLKPGMVWCIFLVEKLRIIMFLSWKSKQRPNWPCLQVQLLAAKQQFPGQDACWRNPTKQDEDNETHETLRSRISTWNLRHSQSAKNEGLKMFERSLQFSIMFFLIRDTCLKKQV